MSKKRMETVCIRCPIGCNLVIEEIDDKIVVTGNRCPRGKEYGFQEFTCPKRTITTIYKRKNGSTLSVRTSIAVDKKLYFLVLKAIKSAKEPTNPKPDDILIKNVLNTSADIVITSVND